MKVLAINGSPRADGNCSALLKIMEDVFEKQNINFEIIHLGTKPIRGCIACNYCKNSEGNVCVFKDDIVNEATKKIREADGIILASPTYYGGIAGTMKCFLDRAFFSSLGLLKHKVGTSVTSLRRSGGVNVFQALNNYLHLGEFILPPSQYWLAVHGLEKEECLKDEEGLQSVRKTAESFAWLLKVVEAGKSKVALPEPEQRIMTNFIR